MSNLREVTSNRTNEPIPNYYWEMPNGRGYRAELTAAGLGFIGLIIALTSLPANHSIREEHAFVIQCGVIVWFALVLIIAEFLRRICILAEEYLHLDTRYDSRYSALLLQVLGFRPSAMWSFSIVLTILVFLASVEDGVGEKIMTLWSWSFGIASVYLIMISVVKISENPVEWDVLLDGRLMTVGHGLAYSYYYGFLRIILPPIHTDVGYGKSIKQRAEDFEAENGIILFSKKLFILIPDSCFCLPNFESMSPGDIERVGKLEDVVVSRAGMTGRPYSATVYRIKRPGEQEPLYVIVEMPSILLTLYEMNTVGEQHAKLSADERRHQTRAFCKILKNLLEEDPACKDSYEIVYYRDQVNNRATSLADLITGYAQACHKKSRFF